MHNNISTALSECWLQTVQNSLAYIWHIRQRVLLGFRSTFCNFVTKAYCARGLKNMELQVGVKILLKNKEGRYLLLERSPEKYPEVKDRWDIVGGRIDPGKTLLENLKREIKEETGLELVEEPKLVAAQDIMRVAGKHAVRLTYVGVIDGEPSLGVEHIAFAWYTKEELRRLNGLDQYIKELLEGEKLKDF